MRVLHTSDWHLGASLGPVSRDAEHARFLDWLLGTLRREAVDVLIVAGDIFDHAQPASEAQALYYRFLAKLAADSSLARVVVVGGNHDSASRLDAPRELLGALAISVVGGYDRRDEEGLLVPILRGDACIGVVAAIPYVNEYRLGVTVRDEDPRAAAVAAFASLHARLAALARTRYPDVPLVATGHLTCATRAEVTPAAALEADATPDAGAISRDDFPLPIHAVGTLGALPPSIFGPEWDYVALGHVHRSFPPESPRVWYSGSPIPIGFTEVAPRRVLLVDLDAPGARPTVRPVEVPLARALLRLDLDEASILARLPGLGLAEGDERLPPLLDLAVRVASYDPSLRHRLQRALDDLFPDASRAPIIANLRQLAPEQQGAPLGSADALAATRAARTPWEIFAAAWRRTHATEPDDAVRKAFSVLESTSPGADTPT